MAISPSRKRVEPMLKNLEIRNAYGFDYLRIAKLCRINLIVGQNGVGKSSLLCALYRYIHGEPMRDGRTIGPVPGTDGGHLKPGKMVVRDPVDDALHHSRKLQLWRDILREAIDEDHQVFATTHSWSCIVGFQQAMVAADFTDAEVIRIERGVRSETGVVLFSTDELAIAVRERIEVR